MEIKNLFSAGCPVWSLKGRPNKSSPAAFTATMTLNFKERIEHIYTKTKSNHIPSMVRRETNLSNLSVRVVFVTSCPVRMACDSLKPLGDPLSCQPDGSQRFPPRHYLPFACTPRSQMNNRYIVALQAMKKGGSKATTGHEERWRRRHVPCTLAFPAPWWRAA